MSVPNYNGCIKTKKRMERQGLGSSAHVKDSKREKLWICNLKKEFEVNDVIG